NPAAHIDPVGSILVPLVLWLAPGNVLFGWARPVPVDPRNYRNYRRGDILVSLAGITANLLLAAAFTGLIIVLVHLGRAAPGGDPGGRAAGRVEHRADHGACPPRPRGAGRGGRVQRAADDGAGRHLVALAPGLLRPDPGPAAGWFTRPVPPVADAAGARLPWG